MKFNYQARTEEGDVRAGQIEASSEEAAVALLQKHGMYVTFLEEAIAPIYAKKVKLFESVSQKDIVLFSRQLSVMFKSKIPLVESLRILSIQTGNSDFREKILKLSEEVEAGTPLSKALARYPKLFSVFYIAMIKSGEVSGKLSEVLTYLADHLEREYHLKSTIKGAMAYPLLVVFVVLIVLILLVFFVIPNLAEVFEGTEASLPAITKFVIGLSEFFKARAWLIILGSLLIIFLCYRYYLTEKGKKFFDRAILRLPIIGNLLKTIYVARFGENLSTLISGGLPIAQALGTVADIIGHASYKKVVFEARDEVKKGEPISSVLARYPKLFPPVFVQMVLVGERTGSLETTLMDIVDFYRREVDREIESFLKLLEPVLIIFLGAIVGGLILSVLMPLYQTMSF